MKYGSKQQSPHTISSKLISYYILFILFILSLY